MPIVLNIPNGTGAPTPITINPGEILFVLGANGVGKSSLLHQIYAGNPPAYQRISAHRQTWFSSNHVSLTARDRLERGTSFLHNDQIMGRWNEWNPEDRINVAIFDIVAAENRAAQDIAKAARRGDSAEVATLAAKAGPIETLNTLFRLSNLPVAVELQGDSLFAKRGDNRYGVEKLSDGERTALLLAATVLTAPAGKVFLIDEPERHLHRSIISPFLRLLLAQRQDCAFLVSTHEVMLPVETPQSRTILLRGCTYNGETATAFDCAVMDSSASVPDGLKIDILGARSTVLFVEGEATSLDKPLYSIVFPGVSIIAKGGCRDVEQAVAGLSGANALHWVRAFGLVDGDRRPSEEITHLQAKGVYAVPAVSVEAIYYRGEIQALVAERQAKVDGGKAQERLAKAKSDALAAIVPHTERLARKAAEATIRDLYLRQAPDKAAIEANAKHDVSIDMKSVVDTELGRLGQTMSAGNLDAIIAGYAVRDTPALGRLATNLGFRDREQYEAAVRKLLLDDPIALASVQQLFAAAIAACLPLSLAAAAENPVAA